MKKQAISLWSYFLLPLFAMMILACSNDNDINGDIPDPEYDYGTDRISLNDWNWDKTHSSVRWESLYLGSSALLTGRFNEFSI